METGRPTKYKPEYAEQARKLCEKGFTDAELADFFEVDRATIYRWKANHEDFCDAQKLGKQATDDRVERSLYERATGYSHPEDKIFNDGGKELVVPTIKHYPPDTTAAIFWLKNRRPSEWRDKQEQEITHNVNDEVLKRIEAGRKRVESGRDESRDSDS